MQQPRDPDTMSVTVAASPRPPVIRLLDRLRTTQSSIVIGLMLAIVMGVGFWLRARDLADRSLWVDELFSVGIAAQTLPTILTVLYGEEANMALYYLLMAVWVQIVRADASEFWIRLPSVLFGVAGLWAMYRLGSRLDRPATGLVAALLGAVNAYHIEMS